jgi:transketolase
MTFDPKNPKMPTDRFVMGKARRPTLYLMQAEKGIFPKETQDPEPANSACRAPAQDDPGVELSTGPLGLGISASVACRFL